MEKFVSILEKAGATVDIEAGEKLTQPCVYYEIIAKIDDKEIFTIRFDDEDEIIPDSISKDCYNWASFDLAKSFAQSLKLKTHKDWLEFCKSGKRPEDMPSHPNQVYKSDGWVSWSEFLQMGGRLFREKPNKDQEKNNDD